MRMAAPIAEMITHADTGDGGVSRSRGGPEGGRRRRLFRCEGGQAVGARGSGAIPGDPGVAIEDHARPEGIHPDLLFRLVVVDGGEGVLAGGGEHVGVCSAHIPGIGRIRLVVAEIDLVLVQRVGRHKYEKFYQRGTWSTEHRITWPPVNEKMREATSDLKRQGSPCASDIFDLFLDQGPG